MTQNYIWQHNENGRHWSSRLAFNAEELIIPLGQCRFLQGKLLAHIQDLGFDERRKTFAGILVQEALKTSEIEGEKLDPHAVRSSVARRLGLPEGGLRSTRNRNAEGVVNVLMDATTNFDEPLTAKRLKGWQAALFPGDFSDLREIETGQWRTGSIGVVSGPIGRQKVHFEAPPPDPGRLDDEMERFIRWFEDSRGTMDGILRAGMAHLWFVTIHPFADGNGRIARTLSDMALAQDDGQSMRFYSLSQQIMDGRDKYYDILERTQKGGGDMTAWLRWFTDSVQHAMDVSLKILKNTLDRSNFWAKANTMDLSDRQRKIISKLFDAGPGGFEGGMTNRKYANMTGASRQTAQRELADLVEKGLFYTEGAGRGVRYGISLWKNQ